MIPAPPRLAKPWVAASVAAMCREPGTYSHPTITGFRLRVSPKLKCVYAFQFRDAAQAMKTGPLGGVAESGAATGLTLDEALEAYKKKRRLHNADALSGPLNLSTAFADWLSNSQRRGGGGAKSERTITYYQEIYDRNLAHAGDFLLGRTGVDDWRGVLTPILKRSPSQAKGAYWLLHAVYHWCIEHDRLEVNPLHKDVLRNAFAGKAAKVKRKTHIRALDLGSFLRGLESVKRRGHGKRAVWVLLLTGWRLSCVLQMRWDRIDWTTGVYSVREGDEGWKGYAGPMALNAYAMASLQERCADGGEAESEYVFPAYSGAKGYIQNVYGTMDTAGRGLGWRVKPHDLRRTFITIADVILDGNLRLVGLLVGHKQPEGGRQGPQRDDAGTDITADYVQRDLSGEAESGRQVAEAILQAADMLPLDDEVRQKFARRGVKLSEIEVKDLLQEDED